ncbi:MAG TPA: 30S ribosomal protein S21 [Acidobacteriota bacterium]|nr:30S ribosomal protein S21 [Acidobacteriota bacterium]HMZ78169.1 30S ribosomal protein S21 [Acidobacteriota bacterium]HNB69697.1 30S ribosomal protein S21 [Acidobacteriota bacterium]HNC43188.1 30S ribosomal protein S21 [Acidobacteriota bacterium]HNG91745.1 30S ribosomal protein S21 [Acidobacteriota bacterium]
MAQVELYPGESIESALRRFKRLVQREGIIADVKKHRFFVKPGERKRLKSELARKRQRSSMRKRRVDSGR